MFSRREREPRFGMWKFFSLFARLSSFTASNDVSECMQFIHDFGARGGCVAKAPLIMFVFFFDSSGKVAASKRKQITPKARYSGILVKEKNDILIASCHSLAPRHPTLSALFVLSLSLFPPALLFLCSRAVFTSISLSVYLDSSVLYFSAHSLFACELL